ncbi:protein disulfide oxidoreductase [Suttonella ornithocola]|uniref:Soluble secreted antigen MPT53 n=1 Tax=Suttonella ornithocola TaxID=279832 RepID=A0A380MYF0_9GAMM|nr:protein disulfide oxidoreductase [Suttonella ornithocola]SUO97600.1 Soluble secreted antigen MPT53 precursor [Suttonella ornithocola]
MKKIRRFAFEALKALIVFLLIYFVVNWWRQPVQPAEPQLQLTDYQGQLVDIAALSQDKPVLIYFWGSWCGICRYMSPKIQQLKSDGYEVVTIAVQSGDNPSVAKYLQEHHYDFTTINDEQGKIFQDWQGRVTPSYVILKQGQLKQGLSGLQPLWSLKLRLWLH